MAAPPHPASKPRRNQIAASGFGPNLPCIAAFMAAIAGDATTRDVAMALTRTLIDTAVIHPGVTRGTYRVKLRARPAALPTLTGEAASRTDVMVVAEEGLELPSGMLTGLEGRWVHLNLLIKT